MFIDKKIYDALKIRHKDDDQEEVIKKFLFEDVILYKSLFNKITNLKEYEIKNKSEKKLKYPEKYDFVYFHKDIKDKVEVPTNVKGLKQKYLDNIFTFGYIIQMRIKDGIIYYFVRDHTGKIFIRKKTPRLIKNDVKKVIKKFYDVKSECTGYIDENDIEKYQYFCYENTNDEINKMINNYIEILANNEDALLAFEISIFNALRKKIKHNQNNKEIDDALKTGIKEFADMFIKDKIKIN